MNEKFFVSYELAQKLKEKGYDLPTYFYYVDKHAFFDVANKMQVERKIILTHGNFLCTNEHFDIAENASYKEDNYIIAPTYMEVLDWLDSQYIYVYSAKSIYKGWLISIQYKGNEVYYMNNFNSRKEALNSGIIRALKYIKQK